MATSAIPNIVGIDIANALQRMDGHEDLFWRLLAGFNDMLVTAPASLQSLQGDELQSWLHQLKGNSGNMSAASLQAMASDCEQILKQGDALTDDHKHQLLQAIEQLSAHCSAALACRSESQAECAGEQTGTAELNQQLAEVLSLLESDYGAAMQCFEALVPQLAGTAAGTLANQTLDTLFEFDAEASQQAVRQLIDHLEGA